MRANKPSGSVISVEATKYCILSFAYSNKNGPAADRTDDVTFSTHFHYLALPFPVFRRLYRMIRIWPSLSRPPHCLLATSAELSLKKKNQQSRLFIFALINSKLFKLTCFYHPVREFGMIGVSRAIFPRLAAKCVSGCNESNMCVQNFKM